MSLTNRKQPWRTVAGAVVAMNLVGIGCRLECAAMTEWDELELELEDAGDPETEYLGNWVLSAMERFSLWNGQDEICVSQVVLAAALSTNTDGEYNTGTAVVTVSSEDDDLWSSAVHEFCHAVDTAEEIAPDYPDLFPPSSVTNRDDYPYRRLRSSEAFARVCGHGPRDIERWRAWEQGCGIDFTDDDLEAVAVVHELVFPMAEQLPWDTPSQTLEWGTPWSIQGLDDGWTTRDVVADGEQAIALSGSVDGPLVRVDFLSPIEGLLLATQTIEPCPGLSECSWEVFSDDDSTWLRAVGEGWQGWWNLNAEGPAVLETDCSAENGDVVAGGTAWWFKLREWENVEIAGCVLATGDTFAVPALRPSLSPYRPDMGVASPIIQRIGSRPAVVWEGVGYAWLDPDGQNWHWGSLPWHLDVDEMVPIPDGRLLLGIDTYSELLGYSLKTFAWLDPETEKFRTPEDACPMACSNGFCGWTTAGDGWALLGRSYVSSSETPMYLPVAWD